MNVNQTAIIKRLTFDDSWMKKKKVEAMFKKRKYNTKKRADKSVLFDDVTSSSNDVNTNTNRHEKKFRGAAITSISQVGEKNERNSFKSVVSQK